MPNRIIREGILSSDRVDLLDYPAEVFYRRLMSKVDDHGLYDARPSILRTSLYPLRVDRVREADITRWIAACEKAGVIALYQHDGKPYLQMMDTRWQARSEAKYPLPPVITVDEAQAPANSCAQVQTVAQVDVFVVGDGDVENNAPGGFVEFWASWPKSERKGGKADCLKVWRKDRLEGQAMAILAHVRFMKMGREWTKDAGAFIPAPVVYLRAKKWDGAEIEALPAASVHGSFV